MTNDSISDAPFQVSEFLDEQGFGSQQFIVVSLCMMVNMLDGFDITAMAVVAAEIGNEMGISDYALGFVFSFSLAGMMLGAMFLASLSDVYGRRKVILASLLIVAISVLLTAYAKNIGTTIVLRFISGLGAGAMLASQATLASEYSPRKYRALCVAIVTAGYPLGAMCTGIVATYLVPVYGWRSMFIGGGIATLCIWMVAVVLIPESLQFLCKKQPKNAFECALHARSRRSSSS